MGGYEAKTFQEASLICLVGEWESHYWCTKKHHQARASRAERACGWSRRANRTKVYLSVGTYGGGYTISVPIKIPTLSLALPSTSVATAGPDRGKRTDFIGADNMLKHILSGPLPLLLPSLCPNPPSRSLWCNMCNMTRPALPSQVPPPRAGLRRFGGSWAALFGYLPKMAMACKGCIEALMAASF